MISRVDSAPAVAALTALTRVRGTRIAGFCLASQLQYLQADMELAHQHLTPIFENIAQMLGATPSEWDAFAPWAMALTQRLQKAAQQGSRALQVEARALRQELKHMTGPHGDDVALHDPLERMRLCQRLWLAGLLDFTDDLLESDATQITEYPA